MTVQPAEEADEKVLSVVATDGYCLRYRVWPGVQPRATMVLVHGVMSHSEWLAPLAVRLASTGLNVIGADRRGSGLNRTDRGDAPSRQQLTADLHEIIKAQRVADQPLYLLGWCWGAVLAINAASSSALRSQGWRSLPRGYSLPRSFAADCASNGDGSTNRPVRQVLSMWTIP